jgi:thiosulfate/3-mercaptopyruvate sulfurtransferase
MFFKGIQNPDGTMKNKEGIKAAFESAGINTEKPIVTSCGTGLTASVLFAGLRSIGKEDLAVYDGSFSEYVSIKLRVNIGCSQKCQDL